MRYKDLIVKYLMIMGFGLLIFYIDEKDFFHYKWTLALIDVLAFFKAAYFIYFSYKKILHISENNIPYNGYLRFMLINIFMVILSFSVDYMCLYKVDHNCFVGINKHFSYYELIFEFWYFSVLNFSFFGYGYLMPISVASKFVVLLEVILSFTTVFFILSDFVSLKESLSDQMKSKKKNNKRNVM